MYARNWVISQFLANFLQITFSIHKNTRFHHFADQYFRVFQAPPVDRIEHNFQNLDGDHLRNSSAVIVICKTNQVEFHIVASDNIGRVSYFFVSKFIVRPIFVFFQNRYFQTIDNDMIINHIWFIVFSLISTIIRRVIDPKEMF